MRADRGYEDFVSQSMNMSNKLVLHWPLAAVIHSINFKCQVANLVNTSSCTLADMKANESLNRLLSRAFVKHLFILSFFQSNIEK